jgi:hypothetical protein
MPVAFDAARLDKNNVCVKIKARFSSLVSYRAPHPGTEQFLTKCIFSVAKQGQISALI